MAMKDAAIPVLRQEQFDALFEGEPAVGVPAADREYQRKAPGAYDAQGDHCGS
ncbi:MAG TPA: hypothetical protein VHJ83_13260 [Micromonosporaceae bacterium]|jgi:hypothetical protein|nr:hypothetical protein [Micromonosporaceae bacterium]